jgi:hypothetical protein
MELCFRRLDITIDKDRGTCHGAGHPGQYLDIPDILFPICQQEKKFPPFSSGKYGGYTRHYGPLVRL